MNTDLTGNELAEIFNLTPDDIFELGEDFKDENIDDSIFCLNLNKKIYDYPISCEECHNNNCNNWKSEFIIDCDCEDCRQEDEDAKN